MFGRRKKGSAADQAAVAVDADLERDIGAVETAVEACLADPSNAAKGGLLAALERLDRQIDRSDAYDGSIAGSGIFGYSTKFSVIGETGNNSMAEEVPSTVLRSQVALVKAAKDWVRGPKADTMAALRTSMTALTALRSHQPADPPD